MMYWLVLGSGLRDVGLMPGWVIFLHSLGKTLFCHSITLNPGVQMGNLFWKLDQMLKGNLVMDWHPI